MLTPLLENPRQVLSLRWHPTSDLAVMLISWILVVASIYTASVVVGAEVAGGMAYFALYVVLGALIFGIGLPLFWMTIVRDRGVSDLGITKRHLGKSLVIQVVLAVILYFLAFSNTSLPSFEQIVPLVALALAIGFFEAVFWRGWVLMRLEESFGFLPALLLGTLLYAAYHIGYGMPLDEMVFLFFIGLMFAIVFRVTNSVFILWPLFQPLGQFITLIRDGLNLPLLASLGFVEVLVAMAVVVWLATRFRARRNINKPATAI